MTWLPAFFAIWRILAASDDAAFRTEGLDESPPVVYCVYFSPEKLDDADRQRVLEHAERVKPADNDIWYLYVRYHRHGDYTVDAYYRPTAQAGNVHRGQYVRVDDRMTDDQRRRMLRQLRQDPDDWPYRHDYVYVSEHADDVVPDIPAPNMLPFAPPEGLSDAELESLVSAARNAVIEGAKAEASRTDPAFPFVGMDASMPICRIELQADTASVSFGWQVGLLNGHGIVLEMKRTTDGWKVTSTGMWVS